MGGRHRWPLVEVGHSMRPPERIKAHCRHDSANFVMAVCSAAFNVVYLSSRVILSTGVTDLNMPQPAKFCSLHLHKPTSHMALGSASTLLEHMQWRKLQGVVMADEGFVTSMKDEIMGMQTEGECSDGENQ